MNPILQFEEKRQEMLAEMNHELMGLAKKLWHLIPEGFDGYKGEAWHEGPKSIVGCLNSALINLQNVEKQLKAKPDDEFLQAKRVWWIELKEYELDSYGFTTLEEVVTSFQKLADAWSEYFDHDLIHFEEDNEVTLALSFKE